MVDIEVVIEVDYEVKVIKVLGLIVVKFGFKICGFCLLLSLVFKDFFLDYGDEVWFFDVDVEELLVIVK